MRTQNPAAIALFNLCCFLAPEEIPLPLLQEHRETLPEELAALLADELGLNEAIGELRRYSLLGRDGEMLAVHRLVQTVALDLMPAEKLHIWADAALEFIYEALPDWRLLHEWIEGSNFLPHMTAVSARVVDVGIETKRLADLGNWIGYYFQYWGEFAAAKPYYERALAISERVLGPDHPHTAVSLNNLGYLLQAMGELAAAKPYFERALAILEVKLGPDHPTTKIVRGNLAALVEALEGDD